MIGTNIFIIPNNGALGGIPIKNFLLRAFRLFTADDQILASREGRFPYGGHTAWNDDARQAAATIEC